MFLLYFWILKIVNVKTINLPLKKLIIKNIIFLLRSRPALIRRNLAIKVKKQSFATQQLVSFRQFQTVATNNKDLKKKIILTNIQKDIIIGTILGDSSLERYGRSINSRLRIDQTFPHHAEYTMHLFSHLINLCVLRK